MSILRQPRGWGGRGTQSSPCPLLRRHPWCLWGRTLCWWRSCWRSTPWDEGGSLGNSPPGRRSRSWCSHTPLSALHSTLSESPGSNIIELRIILTVVSDLRQNETDIFEQIFVVFFSSTFIWFSTVFLTIKIGLLSQQQGQEPLRTYFFFKRLAIGTY